MFNTLLSFHAPRLCARGKKVIIKIIIISEAVELVGLQEIGRRTANITGDATFLFQQLSVALQRGNAVSFQNTFTASYQSVVSFS